MIGRRRLSFCKVALPTMLYAIYEAVRRGGGMKKKRSKQQKWPYLFVAPYLISYFAFGLLPILFSLILSFTDWDGINKMEFVGLKNYIYIFTKDPYFFKSIFNCIKIMLGYIPFVIVLGLLLSVALSSKLLPMRNAYRLVNFFPYITTPVAIGLIFALMFEWSSGTVNRILIALGVIDDGINWLGNPKYAIFVMGFMLIWKFLGYHMMVYSAALATISQDLFEAAEIDGAGFWQRLRYIILPQVQPTTIFLIITDVIYGFQMIEEPMQLFAGWGAGNIQQIGGPGRVALTAVWNMYDTAFGTNMEYGRASAIAYGVFMFIVVFSFAAFRINKQSVSED